MKPKIVILASFYFMSSASLLVLNKVAITVIPNASVLLLVQTLSTAVSVSAVGLTGKVQINFSPSFQTAKAYLSVAAVFLGTIYSNIKLLSVVGVNTFIMLRCSTPLLVSIMDWGFLGRELPRGRSIWALVGILISGACYAYAKVAYENEKELAEKIDQAAAVLWSSTWLFCFTLDMIYIKHVVDLYDCNGLERTLYQNAFSVPYLFCIMVSPLETSSLLGSFSEAKSWAVAALFLSCVAGTVLSFCGMSLRSEISATAFTVLGITCKVASAILNGLFVDRERNFSCFVSLFAAIVSSSLYRQAPMRDESIKKLPSFR